MFYIINNHRFDKNGFAYGEERINNRGDCLYCPECADIVSLLQWMPPYEVNLSGGKFGDFVFGTIDTCLVSNKFKQIYEENGFRGIENFEPCVLYKRNKKLDLQYYYLKIPLINARVNIKKSKMVFENEKGKKVYPNCSTCQRAGELKDMRGFFLEKESIITEDIFIPYFTSEIFFSERLKQATSELTNLKLIEANKYIPIYIRVFKDPNFFASEIGKYN